MTELMKRYEKETGKDAITFSNMATHFTDDYVAWLELQNLLLKLQLTWRPVSEKPEKNGEYVVKFKYPDGTCGKDVCEFKDGDWYWTGIISWFPIPKE